MLAIVLGCACIGMLCAAVVGGASSHDDWGEDHLVLEALDPLGDSPHWVEQARLPAESVSCNLVVCQNVLVGRSYAVTSAPAEAHAAALERLSEDWIRVSEQGTAPPSAIDFRLRSDIRIETTSGTAFLQFSTTDALRRIDGLLLGDGISITLTSDVNPNWMADEVLRRNRVRIPLGALVGAAIGTFLAYLAHRRANSSAGGSLAE